jgi:hypothetical protein
MLQQGRLKIHQPGKGAMHLSIGRSQNLKTRSSVFETHRSMAAIAESTLIVDAEL